MSRLRWAILAAAGLGAALLAAYWVDAPGYTDADYYQANAIQWARGLGFEQPFIWNFLADPNGLPQPAHLYWMPLTSLLAAVPMRLAGESFRFAQLPFLLLAAGLPLLTAWLALRMGLEPDQAFLAGLLAAPSGFFSPYLVTTDAFSLYAWIGSGSLVAGAAAYRRQRAWLWLAAGLLVGAAHLTRADGVLLGLPLAMAALLGRQRRASSLAALVVGYLVVFGPWMLRLMAVSGSPLPPGAGRALWLRNYDELFLYPASQLTPQHLLQAGWRSILGDRLSALGQNLVTLWVVNGLVFQLPLAIIGGWSQRDRPIVRLGAAYGLLLLLAMSLAFPHPGTRGGFFHSSAALMPLLWSLASAGLYTSLRWLAPRRGWQLAKAWSGFGWGVVAVAAVATGFLLYIRQVRPQQTGGGWGTSQLDYAEVGAWLRQHDPSLGTVAVNNPPGFWLASGLPAVVIPVGGESELAEVVREFAVDWVVLERNHPLGLNELYAEPARASSMTYEHTLTIEGASPIHLYSVGSGP